MAPLLVKLGLGLMAVVLCLMVWLQTKNMSSALKSFSFIYEENVMANIEHPYDATNLTFTENVTKFLHGQADLVVPVHVGGGSGHSGVGGLDGGDVDHNAVTPVPELIIEKSAADELLQQASHQAAKLPIDGCDWRTLSDVAKLNESSGRWFFPPEGLSGFCAASRGGRLPSDKGGVTFPIDGQQLLEKFQHKKIVFMGDSVARNSFVLTMARLCNPENYDKCITRCPTMEFDVVNPPFNRGPMGCVPNATDEQIRSPCYETGKFANIPLKGLTLRSVPQDRNGRRNFIRKGLIGPVMAMMFGNVTLLYHPVTKPNQLTRTGMWMARHPKSLLHGDVIIVSIGPHLRLPEVQATPETLIHGLAALRAATTAPILAAEFVHALGSVPSYIHFVDELMNTLRSKMAPLGVTMVPQRFITKHGFMLSSGKVSKSEAEGTVQKGCGYYDPQHPALRCQMVTSDMLLGAALLKMSMAAATEGG